MPFMYVVERRGGRGGPLRLCRGRLRHARAARLRGPLRRGARGDGLPAAGDGILAKVDAAAGMNEVFQLFILDQVLY